MNSRNGFCGRFRVSVLALLLAAWLARPAYSQEVALELEGDLAKVKVKRLVEVWDERTAFKSLPGVVNAPVGALRPLWELPPGVVGESKGRTLKITAAPRGEITVKASWLIVDFAKKETREESGSVTVIIDVGPAPPAPPIPPPDPLPPEPKPPLPPQPVVSFRVIVVTESGKTLPAAQRAVIDAKATRDYLTANTTPEGKYAGWRQYDPQQNVANEQPNMKKLWEAVQPSLTTLPCVVIEVNGKAEILPIAATPAEQIAVFNRYKSGRNDLREVR